MPPCYHCFTELTNNIELPQKRRTANNKLLATCTFVWKYVNDRSRFIELDYVYTTPERQSDGSILQISIRFHGRSHIIVTCRQHSRVVPGKLRHFLLTHWWEFIFLAVGRKKNDISAILPKNAPEAVRSFLKYRFLITRDTHWDRRYLKRSETLTVTVFTQRW